MARLTLEKLNMLRYKTIPDGLTLYNPRDDQYEISAMFYTLGGSRVYIISSSNYRDFMNPSRWIVNSTDDRYGTLEKITKEYATYRDFSFTTDTKEIKRHMMMRELLQ